MTLKERVANFIGDTVYQTLRKKNLNYHVSLRNFNKSKPDSMELFDFSLLSLYNKNYLEKQLYEKAMAVTKQKNQDNLSKRFRHYTLFQLVHKALASTSGGDFVECGCYKGQSAYAIATILKESGFNNRFCIFDSFEGLSQLDEQDKNEVKELSKDEIEQERKLFAAGMDLVKHNLREFDFIDYYKGWIPTRFAEVENKQFSLVNIDVDLYVPIRESLEFFYPRLLKNGVVFLDDYGMSQFPGAKQAVDEFLSNNEHSFFMYLPFGGAFIIK